MYFSATDTTKTTVCRIADKLAEELACGRRTCNFTRPAAREEAYAFTERDLVVFGTPVYAGRVPNVLLPFLKTVRGNGAKAVPVVLYGNRNFDDALVELRDLLTGTGLSVRRRPHLSENTRFRMCLRREDQMMKILHLLISLH